MKYHFCTTLTCLFFAASVLAQLPEDALRLSWTAPSGTARQQAIGGAMGSLGGEISSMYSNPAGLAFYRTGDFILSPGLAFLNNKSNYRGTSASANTVSNFNVGTSGIVFSSTDNDGMSQTFAISVNQTANFKNNIFYQGQNNYSSYSEQFAEEFANSGLSINDGISSGSLSYGTRMALYSYLIDTATINGTTQVIGLPTKAGLLNQQNSISSRGSTTEVSLGYAGNLLKNRKWSIGLSLGIPIVSYKRTQTFTETDATGNTNNDFASSVYTENYSTSGVGFNLKGGFIFNPDPSLRLGFALHSPSLYILNDEISAAMTTNTENYAHEISITSDQLDEGSGFAANKVKYDFNSPWKFIASASYLFGGNSQNVSQQKGFITGDIEYITNRSMKYKPDYDPNTDISSVPDGYFDAVNSAIKSIYKNSFNFRVGGELKFNTFMARAGFAYYTNPYKDTELKADRLFLTAGAGYRNKGMFIDLAYVLGFSKDVNFPYRLSDKANTYATVKQTSGTIMLTIGFKMKSSQ
ncbi:MAG: hypothetical protein JST87_12165 [Bacteroidetes bacterium]|nr:hypothetical protein [Bacteroidota bacterium]